MFSLEFVIFILVSMVAGIALIAVAAFAFLAGGVVASFLGAPPPIAALAGIAVAVIACGMSWRSGYDGQR